MLAREVVGTGRSMPDVRGLLVTALGSPLLPASAIKTVSQSKPLK